MESSAVREQKSSWPDILMLLVPVGLHSDIVEDFSYTFGFRPDYLRPYFAPNIGNDSFSFAVSVGRPKARGEVLLTGKDPNSRLLIDPKYLSREEDIRVLLDGK